MTTMPRFTPEVKNESDINFSALFGMLIDYKWQLLSVIGIFAALGIGYAILATPMYSSNAMIQIEMEKKGVTRLTDQTSGMPPPMPEAVTEIELLKSRSVIGKAIENLKLDIEVKPRYFPLIGNFVARRFEPQNETDVASPLLGLNSFAWGGFLGAAMMSDAEKSLSDGFAKQLCKEVFSKDLKELRKAQS